MNAPPRAHVGFSYKYVIIEGLTEDGRYVCKDNFGRKNYVNASVQAAKGARPRVGEQWMITRELGGWTLRACLSVPETPVITGAAPTDPIVRQLLAAMVTNGHVIDGTT